MMFKDVMESYQRKVETYLQSFFTDDLPQKQLLRVTLLHKAHHAADAVQVCPVGRGGLPGGAMLKQKTPQGEELRLQPKQPSGAARRLNGVDLPQMTQKFALPGYARRQVQAGQGLVLQHRQHKPLLNGGSGAQQGRVHQHAEKFAFLIPVRKAEVKLLGVDENALARVQRPDEAVHIVLQSAGVDQQKLQVGVPVAGGGAVRVLREQFPVDEHREIGKVIGDFFRAVVVEEDFHKADLLCAGL